MNNRNAKTQQHVLSPARAEYTSGLAEALRMLDAFASVGAHRFDVTFLDIDGGKRGFRPEQSVTQLRYSLSKLLPGLMERRNSLVVRPHGAHVTLVQLDDLDAAALSRLESVALLPLPSPPTARVFPLAHPCRLAFFRRLETCGTRATSTNSSIKRRQHYGCHRNLLYHRRGDNFPD
jgi:hypothetical protein